MGTVKGEAGNPDIEALAGVARLHLIGTGHDSRRRRKRRADAVRTALIAGGVPADKITVASRGFTDLAVPTGPNVREAKNRRAEIILQP